MLSRSRLLLDPGCSAAADGDLAPRLTLRIGSASELQQSSCETTCSETQSSHCKACGCRRFCSCSCSPHGVTGAQQIIDSAKDSNPLPHPSPHDSLRLSSMTDWAHFRADKPEDDLAAGMGATKSPAALLKGAFPHRGAEADTRTFDFVPLHGTGLLTETPWQPP